MANKFQKILTTILLISSLSGLSACEMQVSDVPIKIVESSDSENMIESSDIPTNDNQQNESNNVENQIAKYYSSLSQVQSISEALGAKSDILYRLAYDNATMQNTVRRLEHNMGESLKVAIHPSMSQKAGTIAIEQIDYLFNLINSINSNYTYELVEYDENGDFDIVFENRDGYYNGLVSYDDSSYKLGCAYTNKATVYINERAISQSNTCDPDTNLQYVTLHELMHVFGFSDVYLSDIKEIDATTILNDTTSTNTNKYTLTTLTPNDYKNLIALYARPSNNLSQDIEKYKQMCDKYTQKYYESWAESNFENEQPPSKNIENGVYTFSRQVYIDKENLIRENLTFSLSVENNKYTFIVTNQSGKVLETSNGVIHYLNMSLNSDSETKNITNAVAVIDKLQSKYIYEDVYRDSNVDNAWSNIVLYNSNGKLIFKDTLGKINKASPEFQSSEKSLEQ